MIHGRLDVIFYWYNNKQPYFGRKTNANNFTFSQH